MPCRSAVCNDLQQLAPAVLALVAVQHVMPAEPGHGLEGRARRGIARPLGVHIVVIGIIFLEYLAPPGSGGRDDLQGTAALCIATSVRFRASFLVTVSARAAPQCREGLARPALKLDAASLPRRSLCQRESVQACNGGHQAQAEARPGRAAATVPALEPAQELGKVFRCDAWAQIGRASCRETV